MAERQFVILIRNESGGGAGESVGGAGGIGAGNKIEDNKKPVEENKNVAMVKAVGKGLATYGAVRNVVNQIVSHNNSLIEIKTGSRELQERTTFAYNTTMGFVDSMIAGAAAGFIAGGPVGAAAGAVLGAMKQGLSMAINYAKTTDVISKQRELENITRELATQRVTVNGSRYMNSTQM